MKTLSRVLLLSAICFVMAFSTTSCEKEPQGPSQQDIESNIIGKWKLVGRDGKEVVTNMSMVCTYYPGGKSTISTTTGYKLYNEKNIWIDNIEFKYSLNGNVLKEEMEGHWRESTIRSIDAKRMTLSIDKIYSEGQITELGWLFEFVKVTADFSQDIVGMWEGVEVTGEETYGGAEACIEYRADGSYTYYTKKGDAWAPSANVGNEYNVDGDWLAHRWRPEAGADYNYEWWDIESIKDGQMKWTALRARADGSTYATTFTWKKVNPEDVIPYLFIKAMEDGATVSIDTVGNFEVPSIEYSTDGQNWTAFDFGNPQTVTLAKAGDKVFWRNTGESSYFSSTNDHSKIDLVSFVIGDKKVAVGGNIMSLIDKSCQSLTIPCDYCFPDLFRDCTSLVSASELKLPATGLTSGCYCRMFLGCTSLESVPELPATELARFCYGGMFSGCTSLESAPELPATEIARSCYSTMFDGCTSLKTAPALPATELATECYFGMFNGCTSLKTAPALPATELADNCYQVMFEGCISLEEAPALPATELAANCYQLMFEGCISLEEAPALPATELANGCYLGMFYGCTNLRHINVGFMGWGDELGATIGWVAGVSPEGTFECPEGLEINYGANCIPEGWTVKSHGLNN